MFHCTKQILIVGTLAGALFACSDDDSTSSSDSGTDVDVFTIDIGGDQGSDSSSDSGSEDAIGDTELDAGTDLPVDDTAADDVLADGGDSDSDDAVADGSDDVADTGDDESDMVIDEDPVELGLLSEQYSNAPNWNDYVVYDPDLHTLDVGACDARARPSGYDQCRHGGLYRRLDVDGVETCENVEISDALSAFEWTCQDGPEGVYALSVGLARDVRLVDLLELDESPEFRRNSVTVSVNGARTASTEAVVWWRNPVHYATSRAASLTNDDPTDAIGTIFVIPDGDFDSPLALADDKLALVTAPGVGVVGGLEANPEIDAVVTAENRQFLWIEGQFDMASSPFETGLTLVDIRQSIIRSVEISHATIGIGLIAQGSQTTHSNLFDNIVVAHANNYALDLNGAVFNSFRDVYVANSSYALDLDQTSDGNHFYRWTTANVEYGVNDGGSNNTYGLFTVIGSGDTSFAFGGIADVGVAMTSLNSDGDGFWIGGSRHSLSNILSASHNGDGAYIVGQGGHQLRNVAVWGASRDLYWDSLAVLTGEAVVGTCGGPAFGADSCTPTDENIDDFQFTSFSQVESIAGVIRSPVPSDDTNGTGNVVSAEHEEIVDWTHFDHRLRGWGLSIGDLTWPDDELSTWCTEGDTCGVWDARLAADSDLLRDVFSIESTSLAEHIWDVEASGQRDCNVAVSGSLYDDRGEGECRSQYLMGALEISGDGIGNDNALCEADEVCLGLPNYGSYQGHGDLSPSNSHEGRLVRVYLINGNPAFE